jgi:hypothetical protein
MGSRHWNLTGVSDDLQLGVDGPRLIDAGGFVEVRDATGTAFARLKAGDPVDEDDVVTLRHLRTKADVIVTGQIDGSAPPAAGTLGRVFACTTTGGTYTVNRLYYDNGVEWEEIPPIEGLAMRTTDALTGGTVEFLADHVYIWDADGAQWVNVGPATLTLGGVVQKKTVDFTFASAGTIGVGTALPASARVLEIKLNVLQAFDGGGPTLTVGDAGVPDRFMTVEENDLTEVALHCTDASYLYSLSTQVTATLVAPGATVGAANLTVLWVQA